MKSQVDVRSDVARGSGALEKIDCRLKMSSGAEQHIQPSLDLVFHFRKNASLLVSIVKLLLTLVNPTRLDKTPDPGPRHFVHGFGSLGMI